VDFLGTGSTSDNILPQRFLISLAEQPGFALDTKTRMLPVLEHIHTGLIDQPLPEEQRQHRSLPDFEHPFICSDWQIYKAVEPGNPAFQNQNMPMGVKSSEFPKGLVADNTGT
jgi:hypothetical protein